MGNSALIVIDLQNDITKNYRQIIDRFNCAIDRAYGLADQGVALRTLMIIMG